ncbi:hypothetical protein N7457_001429 [Penicillium paradoxum]|uniref:uncharacterized protein n=1 Tax=Penicillium paradoxum TaxID=176176 RepID=UPI0025476CED|nr:uncharacterized protein N7457_001429 [Penicillium paradoxum]KAJ5794830.1 hypothetical protein N7457_001429 [Penicillium paradoxum]
MVKKIKKKLRSKRLSSEVPEEPMLAQYSLTWSTTIELPDLDEDCGHTLVHFLYSGQYETINSPLEEWASDIEREYQRGLRIYQASRTYDIVDLEALAIRNIEQLGEELSILEILRATRDVYSSLPEGETWLPNYIESNLQLFLNTRQSDYDLNELYTVLGTNHQFDNAVMKALVGILASRLIDRGNTSQNGQSRCQEDRYDNEDEIQVNGDHCIAEPACESVSDEPAFDASPVEEPAAEEPPPPDEEPCFIEEEPPAEPPPAEEEPYSPEYELAASEPCPPGEGLYPIEEAPAAEEPPTNEPLTDVSAADVEEWSIPQPPSDVDGWPSVTVSPGDAPRAEELPDATIAPPEPSTETHLSQATVARASVKDMVLYENWAALSTKSCSISRNKCKVLMVIATNYYSSSTEPNAHTYARATGYGS